MSQKARRFPRCSTLLRDLKISFFLFLSGICPGEVNDPSPRLCLSSVCCHCSPLHARLLVNQSRNSSGDVKGQEIGVEYHRLQAFEQYLNSHARDGQKVTFKIIPKAKNQLLTALQRGEGDLIAPGELLDGQRRQRHSGHGADHS